MIKKLTLRLSWLLLLLAGSAAAELKIAALDTQRALLASEEAQSLLTQAAAELQMEESEVKKLGEEILAIQEKLQTDGEVMSPTEQRKLQKEIEDNQIDYQFRVNKLQKAANDIRDDLRRSCRDRRRNGRPPPTPPRSPTSPRPRRQRPPLRRG